jgi:hypothetical protein
MAGPQTETTEPLVTLEEFQRMPEEDAYRVELVRGRIVREHSPAQRTDGLPGGWWSGSDHTPGSAGSGSW